jgi:DNA-binding protein HU-beta
MNTAELIHHIAKKAKITKGLSKQVVNCITEKLIAEVKKGNSVKLNGFGVFYKADRKARKGRNPQNGEPVLIPEAKVPKFKPGKKFREAVKDKK